MVTGRWSSRRSIGGRRLTDEEHTEHRARTRVADQETAAFGFGEGPGQCQADPVRNSTLPATGENGLSWCAYPASLVGHVDGQTPSDVVGVDRHGACAVLHGIGYEHVENLVQGRA